jgi:hypothetical protein
LFSTKAEWVNPKATSTSWTGSIDVKWALPDSITTSAVIVLQILIPFFSDVQVRADWNQLTYVNSGTSLTSTVDDDQMIIAESKFNSAFYLS